MTRGAEAELLAAIEADPDDVAARMVYADWLEQVGDRRCRFIRQHLCTAPLEPDHPERRAAEEELSRERAGLDPAWLAVIEPERRHHYTGEVVRGCACFVPEEDDDGDGEDDAAAEDPDDDDAPPRWREVELHREPQDTECEAWRLLLDYIDRSAVDGTLKLVPCSVLTAEQWRQIVTLPPTIAKLTRVTVIDLYGSHLVRIPPEIGEMSSLLGFTPYTSYRLHWFPYEITRCTRLRGSTVSTRALYGNFKHRPPFPRLSPPVPRERGPIRPCSVCDRPFEDLQRFRVWISLLVGGDVLPLLVNACSAACVERLPAPPEGYVAGPHHGGLELVQPPPR